MADLLSRDVVSFAYPKSDYNEAVEALLGSLGFKLAVTIREGLMNEEPNWLALARGWIDSKLSLKAFAAKTSPAISWYRRLRRLG